MTCACRGLRAVRDCAERAILFHATGGAQARWMLPPARSAGARRRLTRGQQGPGPPYLKERGPVIFREYCLGRVTAVRFNLTGTDLFL